jgi:predicted ATPase
MITGLGITNFKNLARIPTREDEDYVWFGPLNVLIGPNGCGKSSLLQAIDFLRAFFRSSVEVYLKERGWDYRDLPNLRQTRKSIHWSVKAELDSDANGTGAGKYEYHVSLQPRRYLGVGYEGLFYTPAGGTVEGLLIRRGRRCILLNRQTRQEEKTANPRLPASLLSTMDPEKDQERYPEVLRFRAWVEGFRSYLIWDPKVLRYPDRGRHDEIGPSGEHLASVIGRLKDKKPRDFARLVKRLRRLFPTLSDISVSGRGWGWRTIRLHESDGGEVAFNSQQMSDGVLRLLAVTSMLYLEKIPTVITFEEPENGVHPQLVREVIQILRELTQRKPPHRCQVFFSTHSPYVLDEFFDHPEEVYCMGRARPQAGATITRLSENKQIDIARKSFQHSLGEAWTTGLIGATAGIGRR